MAPMENRIREITRMPQKKKESRPGRKGQPLSRREFALASLAAAGAHSLAAAGDLPPLSDEARAMKLILPAAVSGRLEERHITEEDIRRVIDHAETSGVKLYRPGCPGFLAKLRVAETYFYVEYEPVDGAFRVETAYAHRLLLEGDPR